jgi:hypothetical protein
VAVRACAVFVLALSLVGGASAAWSPGAPGPAAAKAKTLPASTAAPEQPTASGRNVTVTWSGATFVEGGAVPGYVVRRFNAITGVEDAEVGADCSGVVAATACTEANVSVGSWKYTVTPAAGASWRSPDQSAQSPAVTVLL